MKCAYCKYNDGAIYTSMPPKYRCTITNEFHLALDDCNVEFAPIVRCKDCKHHEGEEVGMVYCPNIVGGWVQEDFYCCDGVRRE